MKLPMSSSSSSPLPTPIIMGWRVRLWIQDPFGALPIIKKNKKVDKLPHFETCLRIYCYLKIVSCVLNLKTQFLPLSWCGKHDMKASKKISMWKLCLQHMILVNYTPE